jgi:hypothetical protein
MYRRGVRELAALPAIPRGLVRVELAPEHDRHRVAVRQVKLGPDGLRPRPLGRRLRRLEPVVVAGGIEEEAAGVAEQVVPVGMELGGLLWFPTSTPSFCLDWQHSALPFRVNLPRPEPVLASDRGVTTPTSERVSHGPRDFSWSRPKRLVRASVVPLPGGSEHATGFNSFDSRGSRIFASEFLCIRPDGKMCATTVSSRV